jgi:RNA-binding protein
MHDKEAEDKIKGSDIMDKKLKQLRSESKILSPSILVGKNGLTDNVVKNIKAELSKRKLVKIKIHKTYIDSAGKEKAFSEIAERTGARVVQRIGFTITLTKN